MVDKIWKRYAKIEKLFQTLLIISILFPIIIKLFFKFNMPIKIQGFIFFLSLGLFLGFKISEIEYEKALRKENENIKKN